MALMVYNCQVWSTVWHSWTTCVIFVLGDACLFGFFLLLCFEYGAGGSVW